MSTFEYRKLLRASALLKASFKTKKEPIIHDTVFSKNISCVGINLVMHHKLEKDTELEMHIYLSEHKKPIAASGKVLWQHKCSYIPKSKYQYYLTAIQFHNMSTNDAIRTSDFVRDILKRTSESENRRIIDMIENLGH